SAVEAFGVLADNHHVDVVEPRFDAGEISHGANGCVEVELLAELHVHAFEALADRRGDRTFERDLVRLDGRERALREDVFKALFDRAGACGKNNPVDGEPGRFDHATTGGGDFGADAVTGDKNDGVLGHDGERNAELVVRKGA